MKIMLCGGGTGGHITPILAIAHDIKKRDSTAYIIYVGEHGGKFGHLIKNHTVIDEFRTVSAGKIGVIINSLGSVEYSTSKLTSLI